MKRVLLDGRYRLGELLANYDRVAVYLAVDESCGETLLITALLIPVPAELAGMDRFRCIDRELRYSVGLVSPRVAYRLSDRKMHPDKWEGVQLDRWARLRPSDTVWRKMIECDRLIYVPWTVSPGLGRLSRRERRRVEFLAEDHDALLEAAGRQCERCGNKEDLEIDHVLPLGWGGTSARENGQVLCGDCHGLKTLAEATGRLFGERMRRDLVVGPFHATLERLVVVQDKLGRRLKRYRDEQLGPFDSYREAWQVYSDGMAAEQLRRAELAEICTPRKTRDSPTTRCGGASGVHELSTKSQIQ